MRFANYARKSVFSDKSDSVDNQARMAEDYASLHFSGQVDSFVRYSDEDFTGSNTNRPGLQRLLADIKAGLIDVLIVYQLDRLSRDVRDFANIYDILEEHHVHFVSVKENIDTTTPIGKAMMYVTVVFAQMERETIAARVSDNMVGLAKKGCWTGGNPPYGYSRKRITLNGRQHVVIVPDPDGVEYVTNIYDTFLDNNFSLQGMETYYRLHNIRTRNGAFFSTVQLHKILTMPYCVENAPEIYDFYSSKGCIMDKDSPREKWDGTHGVMIYGRTTERNGKHQLQPPEKWIVCIGQHAPFIPAGKWLAVQLRFKQNKFDKTMKYDVPLLKGVLRCSCGSIMSVARKRNTSSVSSAYFCIRHSRQGNDVCDRRQINIKILDNKVMDIFREIEADPSAIRKYVSVPSVSSGSSASLNKRIISVETKIRNLASSLSSAEGSVAAKYIIAEMESLEKQLQDLKVEHLEVSYQERQDQLLHQNSKSRAEEIARMVRDFDSFSASERNEIVRNVVTSCVWDGETLSLVL